MLRDQLSNVLSRLRFCRHAERRIAHRHTRSRVRHREAAARGEVPCARARVAAYLKRQIAPAGASLEDGRDTAVREAIERVEDVVARVVLGAEAEAFPVT